MINVSTAWSLVRATMPIFVYYRLIDSLKTCASIAHHVVGNAVRRSDSNRGLAAVLHILIHAGLFVFGAVCSIGDIFGLICHG